MANQAVTLCCVQVGWGPEEEEYCHVNHCAYASHTSKQVLFMASISEVQGCVAE